MTEPAEKPDRRPLDDEEQAAKYGWGAGDVDVEPGDEDDDEDDEDEDT